MKKFVLILTVLSMVFAIAGCNAGKKNLFLPEAKNDKIYTTIGGENENGQKQSEKVNLTVTVNGEKSPVEAVMHEADDYSLYIPTKGYRYEKDYDDGNLEEKWDSITKDDVEIKITIYSGTDEIKARNRFLRDNDDYIFEDLMGYPLCGSERDGDVLWFDLHEANGNVYIVSWEYPKNTDDYTKAELAAIAESFVINNAQ